MSKVITLTGYHLTAEEIKAKATRAMISKTDHSLSGDEITQALDEDLRQNQPIDYLDLFTACESSHEDFERIIRTCLRLDIEDEKKLEAILCMSRSAIEKIDVAITMQQITDVRTKRIKRVEAALKEGAEQLENSIAECEREDSMLPISIGKVLDILKAPLSRQRTEFKTVGGE